MTCIIGFAADNSVYIGGDSAASDGHNVSIYSTPKVFKRGELVFGFTGSYRMGQLLRYHLVPPARHEGVEDIEYLVVHLIPEIRTTFKEHGFSKTDSSEESGGTFLIGYRGNLYVVYTDYQVSQTADSIAAIGSGAEVALGAMYALDIEPPVDRITRSLEIAATLNAFVRWPFHIVTG